MNRSTDSAILLVGLSGTGKTNFLVGLDVVLDNQTDPNGLVHSDHAVDRAYIQPLREKWQRCEELDHTSRQSPPVPHQLLVCHPATGTRTTFHVPDLAGESFASHFETRSVPHEFGTRVKDATGLILFIHCDHEADHELLGHPSFTDCDSQPSECAVQGPKALDDWTLDLASRQVKLVDLLQFMAQLRSTPLRIAVVVSAWDLVEKLGPNIVPKVPSLFVARLWPLVSQYCECNVDIFPYRVYGVSARGGGHSPEDVARLTALPLARDRIVVVDEQLRSHDLTRPVRWLLGLVGE